MTIVTTRQLLQLIVDTTNIPPIHTKTNITEENQPSTPVISTTFGMMVDQKLRGIREKKEYLEYQQPTCSDFQHKKTGVCAQFLQ